MRFILYALFLVTGPALSAMLLPDAGTGDNIFDERIKTVIIHREEWNLSQPVIELFSSQKLKLEFDLLGTTYEDLYYSFIHCTRDWEPSGLFSTDYTDGFHENRIEQYSPSFNTTVNYIHYSLAFPNEEVKVTLSGNYLILVHRPGESDKPLLTRRFMVVENLAAVKASVRRADMGMYRDTHQQIEISVTFEGLRVTDARSEVFSAVLQNGRWDNAKTNLVADFISPSEVRYTSLGTKNLFAGGNEFRQFDIRSFRYQSEFVRNITYDGIFTNVNLQPSENREFRPYFFRNDFNGKYVIGVQEGINPAVDADYAWVYFTLPAPLRVEEGDIYVAGEFTLWRAIPEYMMKYNIETREYEASLLVKQGWYNYEYIFVPDKPGADERLWFEGSHFETENEYLVLVYYRSRNSRYDRLIGTFTVRNPAA
ncbi:MAG: DUF5103 domain-containing protein [Bacteroidales bacterium]|jgi:hypothetical protein|nr:DUF5103 domain-containing protein [Bacteroidales bacterium]